ncbi:hypothetical protein CSB45_04805 [candidate division KSB3 bacterium]|uniref:Membrane protein 6-pyruvoyl-tetrahydropterin synthase-related domain-containing protein n=1 Tax=candidate division KSB3 bacterium TaxID=2044937 RepID=A0A2G6E813_9BACT|nr:MAG: hypothetical protein CSB45_04805 [candidate division KSB3 bacterium]PIE30376.1 MAG: hypothetical protein CSA57_03575 [candidate division KSB3 bacterium]
MNGFIRQVLKHLTLLLAYLLMACVCLNPLPFHLSEGLLAAESGDPLLQIWVVQWNIHKLSTSLSSYFDANIFYPYSNTFAYHDHLFGLGILGWIFSVLTQNPILIHNCLLLLSFTCSAYGMFLLCRDITQNIYAAGLGGVIFGFLPFRFAHLDHVNILSVYWLPLCFFFLRRYLIPCSTRSHKVLLTLPFFWLCFFLQALTSFNYLFLAAIALGIYGLVSATYQWYKGCSPWKGHIPRDLLVFFAGAGLVGLGLLPLTSAYLKANKELGFERSVQETHALSARPQDYAVAPENNLLYGTITRKWQSLTSPYPREQALFHGILTTVLAGIALLYGLFRRGNAACNSARIAFGALLFAAFVLSLGPFVSILGKNISLPYSCLYHMLPGFKSMRVPARFGIIAAFALAVLASIGVTDIFTFRRPGNTPLRQLIFAGISAGLILLESYSPFVTLSLYPGETKALPGVYQWLHSQPDPLRIVELPVHSPKDQFEAIYYSTFHWHRMLNGRSAFIPNGIQRVFNQLRTFPSQRSIALLKSLAIEYVILHTQKLKAPFPEPCPDGLKLLRRFDNDWLFQVKAPASHPRSPDHAIRPVKLHVSTILQKDEHCTLGVELESQATTNLSLLPEESCWVRIEWSQNETLLSTESARMNIPIFFQPGKSETTSLHLRTPKSPGDYQLRLLFQCAAISPEQISKRVTILPEIIDSRSPHKLEAEFLWDDIPEVWPHDQPLPIRIIVKNSGDTLWKASIVDREQPKGEVRLAVVDWYEQSSGEALIQQRGSTELGARGRLRYDVPPGKAASIDAEIPTPAYAGEFLLELDMLSEHIAWFSPQKLRTLKKIIYLY